MQQFTIHTWRCDTCVYAQDFEPSDDNVRLQFLLDPKWPIKDLKVNECPRCASHGTRGVRLRKVTDPEKKSFMRVYEQADYDRIKQALETETPVFVPDGEEFREETDAEQDARISRDLQKFPKAEHAAQRKALKALRKQTRFFPKSREETDVERTARHSRILSSIPITSPEAIQHLRNLHEDA